MARTNNLTNFLTDVAAAIKAKLGDQTDIPANQFDTKIGQIETVGTYQAKSVNITTNGSQTVVADQGYDALSSVTITVAVPVKQLQSKTYEFTENTHIVLSPESGYDGFSSIDLTIAVPGSQINNQNKTITSNGEYTADQGYTGLGTVTVNVPSIKIFETEELLQADPNVHLGDVAAVSRTAYNKINPHTVIKTIYFPETITLSHAPDNSLEYRATLDWVDNDYEENPGELMIRNDSIYISFWGGDFELNCRYNLTSGLTYTIEDSSLIGEHELPASCMFKASYAPWRDLYADCLYVKNTYFGGLFTYGTNTDGKSYYIFNYDGIDQVNKTITPISGKVLSKIALYNLYKAFGHGYVTFQPVNDDDTIYFGYITYGTNNQYSYSDGYAIYNNKLYLEMCSTNTNNQTPYICRYTISTNSFVDVTSQFSFTNVQYTSGSDTRTAILLDITGYYAGCSVRGFRDEYTTDPVTMEGITRNDVVSYDNSARTYIINSGYGKQQAFQTKYWFNNNQLSVIGNDDLITGKSAVGYDGVYTGDGSYLNTLDLADLIANKTGTDKYQLGSYLLTDKDTTNKGIGDTSYSGVDFYKNGICTQQILKNTYIANLISTWQANNKGYSVFLTNTYIIFKVNMRSNPTATEFYIFDNDLQQLLTFSVPVTQNQQFVQNYIAENSDGTKLCITVRCNNSPKTTLCLVDMQNLTYNLYDYSGGQNSGPVYYNDDAYWVLIKTNTTEIYKNNTLVCTADTTGAYGSYAKVSLLNDKLYNISTSYSTSSSNSVLLIYDITNNTYKTTTISANYAELIHGITDNTPNNGNMFLLDSSRKVYEIIDGTNITLNQVMTISYTGTISYSNIGANEWFVHKDNNNIYTIFDYSGRWQNSNNDYGAVWYNEWSYISEQLFGYANHIYITRNNDYSGYKFCKCYDSGEIRMYYVDNEQILSAAIEQYIIQTCNNSIYYLIMN